MCTDQPRVLKMSSILKYFRRTSKPADNEDLPDPNGPLNKQVPSSAIAKANALVCSAIEKNVANKGVHI